VKGIAPGPNRDFEIKPVIYFIGFGFANIVGNPAGAKIRSRNSVLTGKLLVDNADVPGAIYKDDILGYQVVVIGPASGHTLEKSTGHVDEGRVDIAADSTETAIGIGEPRTAHRVEN